MKLSPLISGDIDSYARSFGITDPLVIEKLRKFTGSMPLALSVAVEIICRKKTPEFLDSSEQLYTVSYLAEELLQDFRSMAL